MNFFDFEFFSGPPIFLAFALSLIVKRLTERLGLHDADLRYEAGTRTCVLAVCESTNKVGYISLYIYIYIYSLVPRRKDPER